MIGLLWFDDNPKRTLSEKAAAAARRYTEKFGRQPNVCYVHPSMLAAGNPGLDLGDFSLRIEARRWVLRDHFFVGVEEE